MFDNDRDQRYTETRLQREVYERNMDESERILTDQHHREFMARAFPDTLPLGDNVPHQTKVATTKMCRDKANFDRIIHIVDNWRPELKIRDMEKGQERDNLLQFKKQFSAGNNIVFPWSNFQDILPERSFVNWNYMNQLANGDQVGLWCPRRRCLTAYMTGTSFPNTLTRRGLGELRKENITSCKTSSGSTAGLAWHA